jgi:hypothetical protein
MSLLFCPTLDEASKFSPLRITTARKVGRMMD